MHIGLIGGIGPEATVSYYQRLTAAMRSLDARLELTIVQADVNDLLRNNAADDRSAQAKVYAELIDRLKDAGADCAAITSLGGHFCYSETEALASLPLVSAVKPLDAYFQAQGYATVGLLGTPVVMRTRLYGQLEQTKALIPDDFEHVGLSYQDMAVAGSCTEDQRTLFLSEGAKLIEQGAQAIILAGTDLNLAFDGRDVGYPVIDALDVHVAELAGLASGNISLA
ncbi:MAG: aspartate/glutamate racemase family protein [Rhodobacteraceae bacterium]|nr:aspartate/glutamate racemase family protein [Paracoccaceae bacterium]